MIAVSSVVDSASFVARFVLVAALCDTRRSCSIVIRVRSAQLDDTFAAAYVMEVVAESLCGDMTRL